MHLLDLRNHGESDHHLDMDYNYMAEDVINYADSKGINKFGVIGHSMGGKVAMTLAMLYPERMHGVVMIDAPPKDVNDDLVYVPIMKNAVTLSM